MTAADRPSVAGDARAEAYRRWPYINVVRRLAGESERERKNTLARDAFTAGAEWAAGRAETTTESRCPDCGGIGSHGFVHVRHGNGGGSNRPCPRAETTTATAWTLRDAYRAGYKDREAGRDFDPGSIPEPAETTTATAEDAAARLAAEVDAEAIRLAPVDDVFPSKDAQAHYRCGFRDGAEWAASRAETTTTTAQPT